MASILLIKETKTIYFKIQIIYNLPKGFVFGCYQLVIFLLSPIIGKYVITIMKSTYYMHSHHLNFPHFSVASIDTKLHAYQWPLPYWVMLYFIWVNMLLLRLVLRVNN